MTNTSPHQGRARPSMADVGRLAEVSAQTVSRFFTGGYVGPETRTRIEAAVAELGYRQNQVARNLRVQRTDTVGFLMMGPINYGNAEILTGVGRGARGSGMSVVTTQLDLDTEEGAHSDVRAALDRFLSFQVDGIVVGTPYLGLGAVMEHVGGVVPVVTLSEQESSAVDFAHADSYNAGLTATRHLIELGHRQILHLAGPSDRNESGQREQGYRDAIAEAGLTPLEVLRCPEWDARSGADHGARIDLSSFTGVFSANDEIAFGFSHALAARGFTAPRDFSIVGIDDMPDSLFRTPPLTTVRIDFQLLGETAIRMLLERIRTGERQPGVIIPAELIVRESTGEPRR